jgi:hypothetical protein
LRRTITTLNRFIISTTSWWADFRWAKAGLLAVALLVLLSCKDDTGSVGFRNPNGDFEVFVKEFTIPTKTFLMDSIKTSYGYATSTTIGAKTPPPNRVLVGHAEDPNFGKTTATAYTQYYAATYPTYGSNPVFLKLTLTLVFDYYWSGATTDTEKQLFEVYELTDSMLTYVPHYSNEPQNIGKLLGQATHRISPTDFDKNISTNADPNTVAADLIVDSLNVDISDIYGMELLQAAMDTIGDNESNYSLFYKFRKKFKGFAIKSPNSDKIVGFDLANAKTRMILDYKVDTSKYQLYFSFQPSGQANGTPEYMAYTQLETDRSGTPLAGLTTKYQDFEPPTGLRYVQAGTGVTTRLDFSEVYEHFQNVSVKAFSVAELRIETDDQPYAPYGFLLRAIKPDNREISTATQTLDVTGDPYNTVNFDFVIKHQFASRSDGGYGSPWFKAEILGDDKGTFTVNQGTNTGTGTFTGYMTNFLQNEVGLAQADFLPYYELIPYALSTLNGKPNYAPNYSRSVNGFYFPPDKVKLKVYYTTPRVKQ